MNSLKGYTVALARLLGTTPAALYERQRALVRAGMLETEGGRGPGSGVRSTAGAVALLLIAALATDSLGETEERTRSIADAKASEGGKCTLTLMGRFKDAIASALVSQARASKIIEITVSRTASRASISYRRGASDRGERVSRFSGQSRTQEPPLSVSASLSGEVFRTIASDVEAMVNESFAETISS